MRRPALKKTVVLLLGCTLLMLCYVKLTKNTPGNDLIDSTSQRKSREPSCQDSVSLIPNQADVNYCQANNNVRLSALGMQRDMFGNSSMYSMTPQTFAVSHHSRPYRTSTELLHAIRNGQRHWVNPEHERLPSIERDLLPSYFVPADYDIPPLSHLQMCNIISSYSHFYTIGDSLSRHMRQAMLMALRNDFILGGVHSFHNKGGPNENMYHCRCDGQFSEHRSCRKMDALFWNFTLRDMQICSHVPEERMHVQITGVQHKTSKHPIPTPDWDQVQCQQNDYRGLFVILQPGGSEDADGFEKRWLRPIVDSPVSQECVALKKAHLVIVSNGAQSRFLDSQFPNQERSLYQQANREREARMAELDVSAPFVDWMNLTADAQTSDGYHFLSDVNLLKAYHTFHLARVLQQESQD